MRSDILPRLPIASVLLAALLLAGCKKSITLRRYPAFYKPQLRTVAVLDLQNDALQDNAGRYMARRLTDAIQAAGTYGAVGPAELNSQLDQAGIQLPQTRDPKQIAPTIAALDHIDAFLIGSVTGLESERIIEPIRPRGFFATGYGWSPSGYHGSATTLGVRLPLGRRDTRLAYAEASIQMIDTAGRKLASVGPIEAQREVYSSSTRPAQLLDAVARELASNLVAEISIVEVQVQVDPEKALQLHSAENQANSEFLAEQKSLRVRIDLPAEADRNELLLLVTRIDDPAVLSRDQFVYDASEGPAIRQLPLPDLPANVDRARFGVTLIAGRFELLTRQFTVRKP